VGESGGENEKSGFIKPGRDFIKDERDFIKVGRCFIKLSGGMARFYKDE